MWKGGQKHSFQGLSDSPVVFLSPITATRSMLWRSFVSPPPPPDEKNRPRSREEPGKVSTFSLWRIREAYSERGLTDLMHQREPSLRMRDREQMKGYAAISARDFFLFFFFFFHFPGIQSIATDWKPIGQVLLNKSDVSSHPGQDMSASWDWRDLLT